MSEDHSENYQPHVGDGPTFKMLFMGSVGVINAIFGILFGLLVWFVGRESDAIRATDQHQWKALAQIERDFSEYRAETRKDIEHLRETTKQHSALHERWVQDGGRIRR